MLLFQICIPFAIEHFKLRTTIKSLLRYWFTAVGWALGLTDYLLPKPEDNGAHDNGNGDLGRQDRANGHLGGQDRALVGVVPDDVNRARNAVGNASMSEELDNDEHSDTE